MGLLAIPMFLSFCSSSKENPGSGALGRWQLESNRGKTVWSVGKWAGTGSWPGCSGGGKHTRAVGKPVGLRRRCASTGSVEAASGLAVGLSLSWGSAEALTWGLCVSLLQGGVRMAEVRQDHRSLNTSVRWWCK